MSVDGRIERSVLAEAINSDGGSSMLACTAVEHSFAKPDEKTRDSLRKGDVRNAGLDALEEVDDEEAAGRTSERALGEKSSEEKNDEEADDGAEVFRDVGYCNVVNLRVEADGGTGEDCTSENKEASTSG